MKKLLFIAIIAFGFSVNSFGQAGQTVQATSTASIVKPLTMVNTSAQALAFGRLAVKAGGAGTVVIDPAASPNRHIGTATDVVLANGPAVSAAKFTASGEVAATYNLTYDASTTLTRISGTETMAVALNAGASKPNTGSTQTIPVGGDDVFYVGGTLTITAGQVSGDYTGTFNVTVAYN